MNEIDTLNDLLNSDLSQVPTDFPVLKPGLYVFAFQNAQIVDTKARDGNKNLKYECVLVSPSPAPTTANKEVQAGFKMIQTIYLPKAGEEENVKKATEIAQKNLAQLKLALTGNKSGGFGSPAQYAGMTFTASVKVENEPAFGEQNRIARFLPKS